MGAATAIAVAVLILAAGLGAMLLLYRGVRWRLIALWPAVAAAGAVAAMLLGTDTRAPWWIFAAGTGAAVYAVLLLTWLGVGPNLSRLFGIRF